MPFANPCYLSPLTSRMHSCLFLNRRRAVSSKFFDTQVPSVFIGEVLLPRHARCVLSLLRCDEDSSLLSSYLSRIDIIKKPAPAVIRSRIPLISFCIVQLLTLCADRTLTTFCLSTTSGPDPGLLPGFWGSMVYHDAHIPRKGSGNNNNNDSIIFTTCCSIPSSSILFNLSFTSRRFYYCTTSIQFLSLLLIDL